MILAMEKICPLQYGTYRADGDRWLSTWRMWDGKPFDIKRFKLASAITS